MRENPPQQTEIDDDRDPENEQEALLARFVAECLLCCQRSRPTAEQRKQVQKIFWNTPSMTTGGEFIERIYDESDGAGYQAEGEQLRGRHAFVFACIEGCDPGNEHAIKASKSLADSSRVERIIMLDAISSAAAYCNHAALPSRS